MFTKAAITQWYYVGFCLNPVTFKKFCSFSKEGKKRTAEAVKVPQLPTSLLREEKQTAEPQESKQKLPAPHCPMLPTDPKLVSKSDSSFTTVKPSNVSGGQKSESNPVFKDDLLNESDPVKMERKRRQQQKKEEFLQQQMKRHKSDDNKSVPPIHIKAEQSSPIPEGMLLGALRSSNRIV